MFRPASRTLLRTSLPRPAAARRFLSTAPPAQKRRSWKGFALRLGLAGAAVYYYNTSSAFAEEPYYAPRIPETEIDSETLPTIESISEQKRRNQRNVTIEEAAKVAAPAVPEPVAVSDQTTVGPEVPAAAVEGEEGMEGLEQEADQQGAFNPETGEINWDCPCLGGMAHGPCGEEFKAAFSCFVYSTEEPKGMDCIDKFKGMQDCFRQHPDIYGSELEDDDDVTAEGVEGVAAADATSEAPSSVPAQHERAEKVADQKPHYQPDSDRPAMQERAKAAREQVKREHEPLSESDEVVPRDWHESK